MGCWAQSLMAREPAGLRRGRPPPRALQAHPRAARVGARGGSLRARPGIAKFSLEAHRAGDTRMMIIQYLTMKHMINDNDNSSTNKQKGQARPTQRDILEKLETRECRVAVQGAAAERDRTLALRTHPGKPACPAGPP